MKAIHRAMPLFDYLSAQDPTGGLVASVYAGVHKVWTRMVETGEIDYEREYQHSWDASPEPQTSATVVQYLQTLMYAPTRSKRNLGTFCPYDYRHQPTIRVTVLQYSDAGRRETILHEIAHAVQYALTGCYMEHDAEWTRIALLMGCKEATAFTDEPFGAAA